MNIKGAILVLIAVTGLGASSTTNFDAPPKRFHAPTSVTLKTMPPDEIGAYCAEWGAQRRDAAGCWIEATDTLAMVDPYSVTDGFAGHLLKHELGHVNGWSATHEK